MPAELFKIIVNVSKEETSKLSFLCRSCLHCSQLHLSSLVRRTEKRMGCWRGKGPYCFSHSVNCVTHYDTMCHILAFIPNIIDIRAKDIARADRSPSSPFLTNFIIFNQFYIV